MRKKTKLTFMRYLTSRSVEWSGLQENAMQEGHESNDIICLDSEDDRMNEFLKLLGVHRMRKTWLLTGAREEAFNTMMSATFHPPTLLAEYILHELEKCLNELKKAPETEERNKVIKSAQRIFKRATKKEFSPLDPKEHLSIQSLVSEGAYRLATPEEEEEFKKREESNEN